MGKHVLMLTHSEYPYAVFGEFKLRTTIKNIYNSHTRTVGTLLVAQLVEALRYKPEGRGFDSRWCHWNFSLT